MNNRDLATILVRFAGLFFAYSAVKKISGLIYLVWVFGIILDDPATIEFTEKVSIASAMPGLISFLITTAIAYYLLRKGNWIIEFLSKDSTSRPDQA